MKKDRNTGRAWRAIRQSGLILLLAVVTGLLTNQARSNTLPLVASWAPEARLTADTGNSRVVSLHEAGSLCLEKTAIFLDARSPRDYAMGHIRGAQNIPWQSFDQYIDRVFATIPEDARIVTYCDGEHCSLSEDLAKELVSMGYKKVQVLLNGWTKWQEAGLPVEKGEMGPSDGRKG